MEGSAVQVVQRHAAGQPCRQPVPLLLAVQEQKGKRNGSAIRVLARLKAASLPCGHKWPHMLANSAQQPPIP
jgi:hypothetical protein